MIDLATFDPISNTRRGILIDLDVAKDRRELLKKEDTTMSHEGDSKEHVGLTANPLNHRRPEITASLLFFLPIALIDQRF